MDGRNAFPARVLSSDAARGYPQGYHTYLSRTKYGEKPCVGYWGQWYFRGSLRAVTLVGFKDEYLAPPGCSAVTVDYYRDFVPKSATVIVRVRRKRNYEEARKRDSSEILRTFFPPNRKGVEGAVLLARVVAGMRKDSFTLSLKDSVKARSHHFLQDVAWELLPYAPIKLNVG